MQIVFALKQSVCAFTVDSSPSKSASSRHANNSRSDNSVKHRANDRDNNPSKHRTTDRDNNPFKHRSTIRSDNSSNSSIATVIERPTISSAAVVPHSASTKHRRSKPFPCTSTTGDRSNTSDRNSSNRFTGRSICSRCIGEHRRKITIARIDSQIRILRAEVWRELEEYISHVRAQFVAALQEDEEEPSSSSAQSASTHTNIVVSNSASQLKHIKNKTPKP